MKTILPLLLIGVALTSCLKRTETSSPGPSRTPALSTITDPDSKQPASKPSKTMTDKTQRTDEDWKKILTPEQYRILREHGTERAFTGRYWDNKEPGIYVCAGCQTPLFDSGTKYDSGSGWPSFYQAMGADSVATRVDSSLGMVRTEVTCARCGGHLGHKFPDGPQPTGQRYCINSGALEFQQRTKKDK